VAIIKDFGMVLREYDAGEANKKLILLTRNHGKLTVFARGARHVGSKLATGLFSYNEYVIYEGSRFYSLTAVVPVHMFDHIAQDYDKFCFAHSFLEMIDKMVMASMDTSKILQILLCSLRELTHGRHMPDMIFAVFAIKLLQTEGFAPLIDTGGIVQTGESMLRLGPKATRALTYILDTDAGKMYDFKASDDIAQQLYRIARLFVAENVDAKIKSLEMIGD